ncbi:AraC family transcriptional regulator [Rapidithrix thailandica]|uniref:AraC family transcriptional regulator n=1 Tax=Rapidithrix thailandica TaxID=413964 RepID=A0AAW9S7B5_9BACT
MKKQTGIKALTSNQDFFQPSISEEDLYTSELVEESLTTNLPYGTTEMRHWYFEGIRVVWMKHKYNGQYSFHKENPLDVVGLGFNLQGNYLIRQKGNEYHVKGRKHNIVYSPGFSNSFVNSTLQAESLTIQFTPQTFLRIIEESNDILKRFADNMFKGGPVVLSPNSLLLNPELHKAIQDLLNCRYTGGLRKMYMLSKCLEILVLQAEAFDQAERQSTEYCKVKEDKERIVAARDYLVQQLENPPSLPELAKQVGLNEYKLKRGFKEMFHTTAFGFLSEYRLDLALETLLDTQKTISEIAYQLGYSSPQHFSAAFKKKFGVPPKEARK